MVHFNYRLKETLEDIHSSHIWRIMQSIKILSTQLSPLYKVVPVHAMKAYGGSRGIAPLILNLDTRREWFSSHPSTSRTPGPNEYEDGWAPEPIWTFWKRDKSVASAGI